MSRCFPFPPPGYERKHTPEDSDLLKEVKSKEKKHKKEKKDKERKKDKEKKEKDKDKDASGEKHKDKKDRKEKHKEKKEKHKDKKKDKEDRVKDKEKSSISEETTVAGKLEDRAGVKLHPKVLSNDRSSSPNEGICSAHFQGQNGGKLAQNSLPSLVNDESKFVRELDRRIRDEEKGTGSQLPEKVAARNSSGLLAEEKVDNKNKKIERKLDPLGLRNEYSGNPMVQNVMPMAKSKAEGIPKPNEYGGNLMVQNIMSLAKSKAEAIPKPNEYGGNLMVQNVMAMAKSKAEGIPKPVDEQNGRRLEDRERYKETGGLKRVDKQKDRDKERQEKEKDREKRKEDKAKIKTEIKKSGLNQLKDEGRNDLGGFTSNHSTVLLKDTNNNAAGEAIIRKRKDAPTNGFLHESEIRPNKIPRPAPPHQSAENGRKLEPSQTPTKSPLDKRAFPNNIQVDAKDRLMNGIIEAQKPSPSKPKGEPSKVIPHHVKVPHHEKTPKVPKTEDLIAEASRRPPHPDSRYLKEVLTVPKADDWPEYDDQDWLFSSSSKPYAGLLRVEEDHPRVWSEAVHIESADVCALPYVIPY